MKKTVCLNMVVKNDSLDIQRCLESVKSWIDYWVIVDTGSTDGTQQIIREFLKDLPGELYEIKGGDGAHNRNEALALAKNKGDYLFLIDADQCLVEEDDFVRPTLTADVYFLANRSIFEMNYQEFLIKSRLDWTWKGALYEIISSTQSKTDETLKNIAMISMTSKDQTKNPDKYQSDAVILEKMVQEDLTNARNVFYLAISYVKAEKFELALETYEKRIAMGGDPEEVFASMLALGTLQEKMMMKPEQFISSYNKAFQYRPTRAEPLYLMAKYYIGIKSYFLGYLIAQYALTIPYPSDRGNVGFSVYDFELLLQFAQCSHALERPEDACSAYRKLIAKLEEYSTRRFCSQQTKDSIATVLPGIKQYVEDNQSKKNKSPSF